MSTSIDPPAVTAVICTLGRHPGLISAVGSLLAQTASGVEVLVIDNDPSAGRVRPALAAAFPSDRERIRVVDEPRRGLSCARNRGVSAAAAPLVAFTDDDALAEPDWIERLLAVFDADDEAKVVCVTGRVLPDSLEADVHRWFELTFGFDKGPVSRRWGLHDADGDLPPGVAPGRRGPLFPVAGGEFGSGNNMAFRRQWLIDHGGFDEALGAGARTRGGEDLDIFRRVVLSGAALHYEAAAVVRHHHRDTLDQLTSQAYGYGTGMAASLTRFALSGPAAVLRLLGCLPAGVKELFSPGSAKNEQRPDDVPRRVVWMERLGYLSGPVLAVVATWTARRHHDESTGLGRPAVRG